MEALVGHQQAAFDVHTFLVQPSAHDALGTRASEKVGLVHRPLCWRAEVPFDG